MTVRPESVALFLLLPALTLAADWKPLLNGKNLEVGTEVASGAVFTNGAAAISAIE